MYTPGFCLSFRSHPFPITLTIFSSSCYGRNLGDAGGTPANNRRPRQSQGRVPAPDSMAHYLERYFYSLKLFCTKDQLVREVGCQSPASSIRQDIWSFDPCTCAGTVPHTDDLDHKHSSKNAYVLA